MKLVPLVFLSGLLAAACSGTQTLQDAGTDLRAAKDAVGEVVPAGWRGRKFAVATAHPLASEAGEQILHAGGSAVDAAIAAQMVLTLVEPQSSGIGGGAFLLHDDGRRTVAFDGRETAPAAATEKLFVKPDGQAMGFHEAIVGGRAVGVPGTVRMLEMAHAEYGKLPWVSLFGPAIRLAEEGFPVSRRLHEQLGSESHLARDPSAAAYFYAGDGQPPAVGSRLRNPELAAVLRRIARDGARALHEGEIAQAIVDKVQKHANPGYLSMADLAAYQPKKRTPLCHRYSPREVDPPRTYRICGFPPPSSGGIAIAQILGILDNTAAPALRVEDPLWMHYYTEASRLAFADRAQYVADPDFVAPPADGWHALINPDYLYARAQLIGEQSMRMARPGLPRGDALSYAPMPEQFEQGTSHLSIVDAYGNALAMTTTIEDAFGARQMVKGFLLNNELSDFSFVPSDADGVPIANRVQPGKRPRSSMSPTLVFDDDSGELVLSAGSPGGALIIHYTAKLLYATLNWGFSLQQAIDLPNFGSLNGPTLLEEKRFPPSTAAALHARGHEVKEVGMTSGLQAIRRHRAGVLSGGADLRREGRVAGE